MGRISHRKNIILLYTIFCLFLSFQFVQAANPEIQISDFSYELLDREVVGPNTVSDYNITVTLHNSGEGSSGEILVNLEDEEIPIPLTKNITLQPHESKTVFFLWGTYRYADQNITISFGPPDIDNHRSYNSGSKIYRLDVIPADETHSTPGFECLFILLILFSFILYQKKNK